MVTSVRVEYITRHCNYILNCILHYRDDKDCKKQSYLGRNPNQKPQYNSKTSHFNNCYKKLLFSWFYCTLCKFIINVCFLLRTFIVNKLCKHSLIPRAFHIWERHTNWVKIVSTRIRNLRFFWGWKNVMVFQVLKFKWIFSSYAFPTETLWRRPLAGPDC